MKLRKVKTSICPFTNSKICEMTNDLSFCQFPRAVGSVIFTDNSLVSTSIQANLLLETHLDAVQFE